MGTHDFIRFPPRLESISRRGWLLLGEIQARIEHIKKLPIPPEDSNLLRQIYLSKGVHSTTAIEGNSFSEQEVAKIINNEMTAPPSRAYQQRQIENMVRAFSAVAEELFSGDGSHYSLQLLHSYHELVLDGLQASLSSEVTIGQFRSHRVTVGRYLAPDDVSELMAQYCDWLNAQPNAMAGYELADQIVKAIVAHVYFAWIHPYGDGNGRLARLLEFAILLNAGFPDIAAHLLSNFYNDTRDMYYHQLQGSHGEIQDGSYPDEANLHGFLEYALQGLKDELDRQFERIYALQFRSIWHDVIHAAFRKKFSDNLSKTRQRQKRLVLDLTERRFDEPVSREEIPSLSAALARAYHDKTARTIQRDLNELVQMALLKRVAGGYLPNTDILLVFFARARDSAD